jgi:hypothetical protein
MEPRFSSVDSKISALEANQGELRELLQSVSKLSEVKALFDSFMEYQQNTIHQQQQETSLHRQQQQQQMQLQQSSLQHQQRLLEHQQQQLAQQQLQLEKIALLQQSRDSSVTNHEVLLPSAPPLSIERDE